MNQLDNGNYYKWGIFYFNKSDPRAIAPKRSGLGWTLNFGNPWAYFVLLLIVTAIIYYT